MNLKRKKWPIGTECSQEAWNVEGSWLPVEEKINLKREEGKNLVMCLIWWRIRVSHRRIHSPSSTPHVCVSNIGNIQYREAIHFTTTG